MQKEDKQAEIENLKNQLSHYEKLLDQAFDENSELAKTKAIFHEMKKIWKKY